MVTFSGDSQRFDPQYNDRETRVSTMSSFAKFFYKLERGENREILIGGFLICILLCFVMPSLILLVMGIIPFLANKYLMAGKRTFEMPMRLPIQADVADGSNMPATGESYSAKTHNKFKAKGTLLMGQERETKQQVWLSDDDMLTHIAIIGTTKSGKTFVIFMFMLQALVKNSGFLYADAKGDITTLKNICQLLRRFGRQDDFLLISFLPYELPEFGDESKVTNTMNIFRVATATTATELVISMLSGADDVWKDRTIAFATALFQATTTARDLKEIELSANKILELTELKALEKFVWDLCKGSKHARLVKDANALETYLLNIPSYDKAKAGEGQTQDSTTKDQHGYVTMQLLRALNDLSYNYGHIFGQEGSDVDMVDVVFNRRNLVIALPALGRSVSTLSMLARIIISSIKQVGAIALGSKIEGSVRLNIDARPSNARNIYTVMLDEVGYMMTQGMSIMPAQFRAYNISVIFSGQSYANFKKDNELEAQEIWTNTNIKIIGRYTGGEDLEDWTKVQGLGGKHFVPRISHLRREKGHSTYNPSQEANFSEEWRIRLEDVATQESGEFAFIMGKKSTLKKSGADGMIAVAYTKVMYPLPNESISHVFVNELIHISNEKLSKISPDRKSAIINEMKSPNGIQESASSAHMMVANGYQNGLLPALQKLTTEYEQKQRLHNNHGDTQVIKPIIADIWIKRNVKERVMKKTDFTPEQVLKDGYDELRSHRLLDLIDFDNLSTEVLNDLYGAKIQQSEFKTDGLEFEFGTNDDAYLETANKRTTDTHENLTSLETLSIFDVAEQGRFMEVSVASEQLMNDKLTRMLEGLNQSIIEGRAVEKA